MAGETFFLSYSRIDEDIALRFADDLRAAGVSVWVDQYDIRPSEHWDRAIERAVQACGGLIVILSPRSAASDNVADEISFAIEGGKKVLPILIEKCTIPLRITRMHMIDATASYDRALRQCLAEIQRVDGVPPPRVAPAARPAPVPLAPEAVSAAERQLAGFVGPIASILAAKAAARAGSVAELYGELALHVQDDRERKRFLAAAPQGPGTGAGQPAPAADRAGGAVSAAPGDDAGEVTPAEIEHVAGVLVTYLGPMAALVAKRESRSCRSAEELRDRVAQLIPGEKERGAFLRRVEVG